MKYKYEFELNNFTIGNCTKCPLTYLDMDNYGDYTMRCGIGSDGSDCPLEEVKEGYWYGYDPERCSVCKLPWNDNMTMNGDDIGYFEPMPNFCPNCGAKMRSDKDD